MPDPATVPHDYRVLFAGEAKPVVVGGQAINLWAITYLEGADLYASRKYSSHDLDVLDDGKVLKYLKSLPDWSVETRPIFGMDVRAGRAVSVAEDGRRLLVEVLTKVHGLGQDDLQNQEIISHRGTEYRVLDPIAMLKAKAANVRDIKQDETDAPRHDREHLAIIAQCLPHYLRNVEQGARQAPDAEVARMAARTISRAFEVLSDVKVAATLRANGIEPASLMPAELAQSPIAKIAVAYTFQMPRLATRRGQRLSP